MRLRHRLLLGGVWLADSIAAGVFLGAGLEWWRLSLLSLIFGLAGVSLALALGLERRRQRGR